MRDFCNTLTNYGYRLEHKLKARYYPAAYLQFNTKVERIFVCCNSRADSKRDVREPQKLHAGAGQHHYKKMNRLAFILGTAQRVLSKVSLRLLAIRKLCNHKVLPRGGFQGNSIFLPQKQHKIVNCLGRSRRKVGIMFF